MVAVKGPRWQLAPCLITFINELDKAYPNRDTRSDGSIGDPRHQARISDHNPSEGYVHAVDFDNDIAPQVDAWKIQNIIAERIKAGLEKRVEYLVSGDPSGANTDLIFSRKWFIWAWRKKSSNDHRNHHGHISIKHTTAARNDTSPWLGQITPPKPTTPQYSEDDEMELWKKATGSTVWLVGAAAKAIALTSTDLSNYNKSRVAAGKPALRVQTVPDHLIDSAN